MVDDVRSWPGYTDFGRIARLPASRGRLYVLVDPATRALHGEVLLAGGERWGEHALEQLNAAFAQQQPARGLARTRHVVQAWRARGIGDGGGALTLWYRSTIRQHKVARAREYAGAAGGVQDSAFVRPGQRVVLVHARWRASVPHARPAEPLPGEQVRALHAHEFVVTAVERSLADGRRPVGPARLALRTALLTLVRAGV